MITKITRKMVVDHVRNRDHVVVWLVAPYARIAVVFLPTRGQIAITRYGLSPTDLVLTMAAKDGKPGILVHSNAGMGALVPQLGEEKLYRCPNCGELHDADEATERALHDYALDQAVDEILSINLVDELFQELENVIDIKAKVIH